MEPATATNDNLDSAKRQQILEGARRCFMAQGFDAASMNDIVKAAGVSKGTLYAYFPSKEKLFEAMVFADKRRLAEQVVAISGQERPVEEVLRELGLRMTQQFLAEDSLAYLRMVLAAAAKFPEVGRAFYEAGPAFINAKIAAYLKTKIEDGTLRPMDADCAAMQFVELVQCGLVKPRLFSSTSLVKQRSVEEVVEAGLQLFLKGLLPR
ncbi:MAG: TetR/AcrR family transcriptional regulator [Alphaproteobacteria bacterium]|nr:TetR/AcrR family transcriptional regulator [Alphaproteobacteria bacterium]